MRITENQLRKVIRQVIEESMLNEIDFGFSYDSDAALGAEGHAKSFEEMMKKNIFDFESNKEASKHLKKLMDECLKDAGIQAPSSGLSLRGIVNKLRRRGQEVSGLDKCIFSFYASIIPTYQFMMTHPSFFKGPISGDHVFAHLAAGTFILLLIEAFLYGTSHSKANMIINKLPKEARMSLKDIVNNQAKAKEAGYSVDDIEELLELYAKIKKMNDKYMLLKPDLNQKH